MKNKIFKIFYSVVVAVIVIIAVLLMISVLPITGNYKILVVKSGSMEPTIKTGSIVVVRPAAEYKKGEIITFVQANKTKTPITHRIENISNNLITTKGDANNAPDDRKIRPPDIIGRLLFSVPYAGYAVETARKPYGFILIIIVPALFIIFDEIKKIIEYVKEKKKKTKK